MRTLWQYYLFGSMQSVDDNQQFADHARHQLARFNEGKRPPIRLGDANALTSRYEKTFDIGGVTAICSVYAHA